MCVERLLREFVSEGSADDNCISSHCEMAESRYAFKNKPGVPNTNDYYLLVFFVVFEGRHPIESSSWDLPSDQPGSDKLGRHTSSRQLDTSCMFTPLACIQVPALRDRKEGFPKTELIMVALGYYGEAHGL